MSVPILIVGAGPTGLNLALRLKRHGAPFRIIDERSGPAQASRALAVAARTLELYDQLGLAHAIVARGTKIEAAHFMENGEEKAYVSFKDMGANLSPYGFILDFPQDEHERFLVGRLEGLGVDIEWGTKLERFSQQGDGVDCTLRGPDGEQALRADWLCGCDGAQSAVRTGLAVGFSGGTYEHEYYVADVTLNDGDDTDAHIALGRGTFAFKMPARRGTAHRLIGLLSDGASRDGSASFETVRASAEQLLRVSIGEAHWFSTYRVHHRVASHFRIGRAFLAGDAGHLHSPVGGQGMNTGIGDAVNLAWKLAAVVSGRSTPKLLDSYECERIGFARQLVATTDRIFQAVVSGGIAGKLVRRLIVPHILPGIAGLEAGRTAIFRLLSQIRIAYPDSDLSEGHAGHIHGGDRLPWVPGLDNFAPLRSLDWQVHAHGVVPDPFAAALAEAGLTLSRFAFSPAAREAGYHEGAAYLVRPDGYVAVAQAQPDAEALLRFLAPWRSAGAPAPKAMS
jgi:2-polyprenyl-6-methoxyphenol hydroxylase-like FAD-dependent oxidoreductase